MKNKIIFVLRFLVAIILIQTLYFKFTAHPDSVYIFSEVGLEPNGRILIGVLELLAAILILVPKTVWMGAILSLGLISGAIMMHLTKLGIEVKGDGGLLFGMAVAVFVLSFIILWVEKTKVPVIKNFFKETA